MNVAKPSVLALVPARGGSKGIVRKNLRTVGGRSLIAHAARIATSVPDVTTAIASTDDAEMAAEAVRYGLQVPFMRPAELASDSVDAVSMWRDAWRRSEAHYGMAFEVGVLLEPTSPLRRVSDVVRTIKTLTAGEHAAAATVSRTPAHYTPHKTLLIDESGQLQPMLSREESPSLRQLIPEQYHRNGICYAVRRETLVEHGTILERGCVAVVIERPVVNIDEPFDLELAEWLLERERNGGARDR